MEINLAFFSWDSFHQCLFLFTFNKSFQKLFFNNYFKTSFILSFYKEFLFITCREGVEEIFRGRGGAHGFKGERRRAKEKFNSHMPYLLLGAEHVCLREGQKLPTG